MGAGMDFWMFDRMMDMSGASGGDDGRYHNDSYRSSDSDTEKSKIYDRYPYRGCSTCEKVLTCEEVRIWQERHFKDWCPDGIYKE